jgi:hypothetical protein
MDVTSDTVKEALNKALDRLIQADEHILRNDVNERSISHKLAEHLAAHFPGWNVDCEYNRNHDITKQLNNIKRIRVRVDDTDATTVFPDIIVHKRGMDDNLLVIELKKSTSRRSDSYDKDKLRAFKEQLGYQFAVFVQLKTEGDPKKEKVVWI